MLTIKLIVSEYKYLEHASFLPNSCKDILVLSTRHEDTYSLKISEEQADEIRDLCGEQLQVVGFDEKYELTSEGKILESLIDIFFSG